MFRVTEDTTVRRVAATALIVLAGALASCGDDAPGTPVASTPASTPAATTATLTTPVTVGDDPAPKPKAKADDSSVKSAAPDSPPAQAPSEDSTKPAGTDKPAGNADTDTDTDAAAPEDKPKKASARATKADVKVVESALKKAGYKPILSKQTPNALGAIQVNNVSVIIFDGPGEAGRDAQAIQKVLTAQPKNGRLVRVGSRLYFVGSATTISGKDLKEFKKVKATSEAALAKSN